MRPQVRLTQEDSLALRRLPTTKWEVSNPAIRWEVVRQLLPDFQEEHLRTAASLGVSRVASLVASLAEAMPKHLRPKLQVLLAAALVALVALEVVASGVAALAVRLNTDLHLHLAWALRGVAWRHKGVWRSGSVAVVDCS